MTNKTFVDQLQAAMRAKKSVLCVGLDPQLRFMPPRLIEKAIELYGETWEALAWLYLTFNKMIIDAVEPSVGVVKPQAGFYNACHQTWETLEETIFYAQSKGLVVIKDAKCKDGGETAEAYAQAHIGEVPFFGGITKPAPIRADAVTIDGYIAEAGISHFVKQIKQHGTGAFVVTKTSFTPNSEIEQLVTQDGLMVWEKLAQLVNRLGEGTEGENGYRNLGAVMGATYPSDAIKMRKILPKAVLLGPGYGGQGATADDCATLFNDDGFGAVINSSRAVIGAWQKGKFARDPRDFVQAAADAAEFSRNDLNAALQRANKYNF